MRPERQPAGERGGERGGAGRSQAIRPGMGVRGAEGGRDGTGRGSPAGAAL